VERGVTVGLVCAVQYGPVAYIGPMGVDPDAQGKGIGRALMKRLVASLEARHCMTMMLDATEAGEPLYRKFGFEQTARTYDMTREAGPGIRDMPGHARLEQAVRIDEQVFSANREPLFQRLLQDEGAALFGDDEAFLVAQTKLLGPFSAFHRDAAARLLDLALDRGAVAGRVLAPVENPEARGLLESRGFQVQREGKHMRRGRPCAMRRDLMYGLASFALG
jgi:ribosomal protein S18 acetylase RimI-like enzyme